MKLQCVTVCVFSVWAHSWARAAGLGCQGNTQTFISLDTSLLPISNVVASRNTLSWPDENFINFGPGRVDVWCVFAGALPHVNLTFLEPVVVTGLISGGYTFSSGTVEYVNNFTIQYSTVQGLMGSLNVFTPAINTYYVLEEPFAAERMMLLVEEFIGGGICWSLAVIGCRMSETFSSTLAPSSAVPNTLACSSAATPPPQTAEAAEKDFMVLAIALPIAIVTIAAVAVIVTLGMCICVQARHKSGSSVQHSAQTLELVGVAPAGNGHPQEGTLREVQNILYEEDAGDTGDRRQRAETVREVQNILYEDSSRGEQTYEPVPSSNAGYSVPFQPHDRIQTMRNESYSMCIGRKDKYEELPQEQ